LRKDFSERAVMRDSDCIEFLQWALPRLELRWSGYRKVHRQVCKRLRRRLNELELDSLAQYRSRLERDAGEWAVLDGLCHITISRFYRDRGVFGALGNELLPELARAAGAEDRPVRCWCAGCASGEEVYTLKLLWDLQVQPRMPEARLEIIGTDADEAVLKRAETGCYPAGSLSGAPPSWRTLAFDACDHCYCVRAEHREGIEFALQDIRREQPAGHFDLVLCRNLAFTYFEPELQRSTLDRLAAVLREGGYLVIGAGERLPDGGCPLERLAGHRAIFKRSRLPAHGQEGERDR
jgi:chemotaxis protein methyltransferase CheR